jgi:hypothetical protein
VKWEGQRDIKTLLKGLNLSFLATFGASEGNNIN